MHSAFLCRDDSGAGFKAFFRLVSERLEERRARRVSCALGSEVVGLRWRGR